MSTVYVCMHIDKFARLGGSAGVLPKEIFFKLDALRSCILGQKQCSSRLACRLLHPDFGCPKSQLTSNLYVLATVGRTVGG